MICEVCGCSEARSCLEEQPDGSEGPCFWVAPGLCSACEPEAREAAILDSQPNGGEDPRNVEGVPPLAPYRRHLVPRQVA